MRCSGGNAYIEYVKNILECRAQGFEQILNYEFKLYDNVDVMIDKIRTLDDRFSLCKTVAGYSWDWLTKPKHTPNDNLDYYNSLVADNLYDINIGRGYIWNVTTEGWINREDSHYTIGCIHTTQGFDLNYVGVIFGREIDYNPITNNIEIYINGFKDINAKRGCNSTDVKRFILNAYSTIMARGIKGCYVYAVNENLRNYLARFINRGN